MRRQAFDYYVRHESVTLERHRDVSRGRRRRRSWPAPAMGLAAAREAIAAAAARAASRRLRSATASPTSRAAPRRACGRRPRPWRGSPGLRLDALIGEQARRRHRSRSHRAHAVRLRQDIDHRAIASGPGRDGPHEPEADDQQPRSLDELRDELASHLERIVAEEEARGSDGLLV